MASEVITKRMDVMIEYIDLLAIQPDIAHWFKVLKKEVHSVEKNSNNLLLEKKKSLDNNQLLASIQKEEQNLLRIYRTSWKSFQLEYRLMHDKERKKRYEKKHDRYEAKLSYLKDLLEKSKNESQGASWEADDDSCGNSKDVVNRKSHSFETVNAQTDTDVCHLIDNFSSQLRVSFKEKVNIALEETNGSSVEVAKRWHSFREKIVDTKRQVESSSQNIFEDRDDQLDSRPFINSNSDPFNTCLGGQVMRESWNEFWK